MDAELTALVGESYNRAYHLMVSVQLLSELEEIIQCLVRPEKKKQLQKTWWNRLQVRTGFLDGRALASHFSLCFSLPPLIIRLSFAFHFC